MLLVDFEHFVFDMIKYVNESHNYERAMQLIIDYRNLLDLRIERDMFADYNEENPLFNTNYDSNWFHVNDLTYIIDYNPKSDYCGEYLQSISIEDEND